MKRITTIIISLLFTITTNAQVVKKYSGQMSKPEWIADIFKSDPYDINGNYSYYEDENEKRIIHGAFHVNYKTGELNLVRRYEISGSFCHGKRDGKWITKAMLINGKYARNNPYQLNYTNGVLNGPFQICVNGVEMLGLFSNGLITGKVTVKQHAGIEGYIQYEGRVNSKGNPHGIWIEKEIREKAIPKDITRLYYDGNMVYRKEIDLSSGKVEYTEKISDKINNPADSVQITDTVINGQNYINVGGTICRIDDNNSSNLYYIVCSSGIERFYHKIKNWKTSFDTEYYPEMVKKAQEEQQRILEEKIKKEKRKKEAEERRIKEEELRKKKEAEAKLNEEIEVAWAANEDYYSFCWGRFEAKSKFKMYYKEIGLDSINSMLDSISLYEYNNYTVEELFRNNVDSQYYVYNVFLSDIGNKRKKKLNKIFKSYDAYIECKKQGAHGIQKRIINSHRLFPLM